MVHPAVFEAVGYDPRALSPASPSAWASSGSRCCSSAGRHPAVLRKRPAVPGAVSEMKALVSWLRDCVEVPDGVSIDALAHACTWPASSWPASSRSERRRGGRRGDRSRNHREPARLPEHGRAWRARSRRMYDTPLRWRRRCDAAQRPLDARRTTARPAASRVTIEDATLCPRYAAAVADITVGPSPAWLVRAAGRRRHPQHQQHRRHHQLRADRDGPSAARVRSRTARRARTSGSAARSRARR